MGNHEFAQSAAKREQVLITYLGDNPEKQTYSDNLTKIPEFIQHCRDDKLIFDFVRVAIIDLTADGLISLDALQEDWHGGWKLTERGREVYQQLKEPDVPFENPFGNQSFQMYNEHREFFQPNGASCPQCNGINTGDAIAQGSTREYWGNIGLFACHDCQEVIGDC